MGRKADQSVGPSVGQPPLQPSNTSAVGAVVLDGCCDEGADMWTVMSTPVGELRVVEHAGAITAIEFEPFSAVDGRPRGDRDDTNPLLVDAVGQLTAYFNGELTEFDLPLAPHGTAWQRQVWEALVAVPYGATATYGDIAHRLGKTNAASRAVGTANGQNPIAIVIGCHRIIGADGSLTGYAGGLARKRFLLDLESDALF